MPMNLRVVRDVDGPTWTLSRLMVDFGDGKGWLDFGYGVEDVDRGLDHLMSEDEVKRLKVEGKTAIPTGTYKLVWHTRPSGEVVPMLEDVKGYRWVLVHPGNSEADTEGCYLPGISRDVKTGRVSKSVIACTWLFRELRKRGLGTITIERATP